MKDYYNIELPNGEKRQVWDIELLVSNKYTIKKGKKRITNIELVIYNRFCDAFEYVARAGRKDINTEVEDLNKAKTNISYACSYNKEIVISFINCLSEIIGYQNIIIGKLRKMVL